MVKKYLLDTNILIDLSKEIQSTVLLVKNLDIKSCEICSVVTAEYFVGAYLSSNRKKQLSWYFDFIRATNAKVLPFDEGVAEIFGEIQARYMKKGWPRLLFDLQIASTVIKNNLTLVTKNIKDFEMIDGLRVYKN